MDLCMCELVFFFGGGVYAKINYSKEHLNRPEMTSSGSVSAQTE